MLVVSIPSCLGSLVMAIMSTFDPSLSLWIEEWLKFGTFLLISFQSIVLFITASSTVRYQLGIYGGGSSLVLAATLAFETISIWEAEEVLLPLKPYLTFSIAQFVSSCILVFANLLIPRRADVYHNGKIVDRQHTTSILGKFTFSWATSTLNYVATNKGLDIADLPEVEYQRRSQTLLTQFEVVRRRDELWKVLFWARKAAFIEQWAIQALCSLTNFLPQVALYFPLKTLESRDVGANVTLKSWLLVSALGAAAISSSWIEAWMLLVSYLKVGIPMYEQLSIVIFSKSMRKKDVKDVGKKSKSNEELELNVSADTDSNPKSGNSASEAEKDDLQRTRQSTINLISVDAKRISDFATLNYIILGYTIKLIVAVGFLSTLIGWIPLLSGFAIPLVISPINIMTAKRYANAQVALMRSRDLKMSTVTEALQGIRQIKYSALENAWYDKILEARRKELKSQWIVFIYNSILISIWIFGPVMLSAISLTVFAIIHRELSASVAFTTVAVFETIENSLSVVPKIVTNLLDSLVTVGRIQDHLNSPERDDSLKNGDNIIFENATVTWPSNDNRTEENHFRLRSLDLNFPKSSLSIVYGKTGSGKSLLLSSILGEADILSGNVLVPKAPHASERYDSKATKANWIIDSSIPYVAQIPWVENASIRDNILFGLPMDHERYTKVLDACALQKDLEMLQDGELTDIGTNGINLSGGQKWRVSFARALYSRAGILVLDDIFSAENLVKAALEFLLRITDVQAGPTEELRNSGKLTYILAQEYVDDLGKEAGKADETELLTILSGERAPAMLTGQSRQSIQKSTLSDNDNDLAKSRSHSRVDNIQKRVPKKFTEEEKRETGHIIFSTYAQYIQASGGSLSWTLILIIFSTWLASHIGRSYWVTVWTRSYNAESINEVRSMTKFDYLLQDWKVQVDNTIANSNLWCYLGIYLGISLLSWIIGTTKYFCTYLASIRASKVLFEKFTFTVLRAPLRWLDTNPLGRILNRFTSDFGMIDSQISMDIAFILRNAMMILSVIIAGFSVSPFLIIFSGVLLAISMYFSVKYLAAGQEIKQLESKAKSPVFEQFGSALAGIGTIRAFDKTDSYLKKMRNIDSHCRAYWHLCLSESVIWAIRQYANLAIDMNAVERIVEYSNMTTENYDGRDAPTGWPTKGRVDVEDLVVGYGPELPPVLRGLTFSINGNERIGVIGRTGAGKSSLTLALFRFLEAQSGSIRIDGLDISQIKLFDLRSRLAIIPQDPVLFSGTIRSNLGPFDQYNDSELHDALSRVHLTSSSSRPGNRTIPTTTHSDTNIDIFQSLSSKISEGGLNLSQGQRQLLCLAREIISRSKLMVLDEATSAVDMETDALIQQSIREEFKNSTLIVIAHRLSTVADFDKILVIDRGKVAEFDTPKNLMQKENSYFNEMVLKSTERSNIQALISDSCNN
ncbi:ABC bile acid transporter [Xylogone sp. PMI_703]|nr:ABC bile acid transporter [Xylogone sp. PMI_703]